MVHTDNLKNSDSILGLTGILLADYYDILTALSGDVLNQLSAPVEQVQPLYSDQLYHCLMLAGELAAFIAERKQLYMPYFIELSEKNATGHDCSTCSGRCDMQHTAKMIELEISLEKLRNTIDYVDGEIANLLNAQAAGDMIRLQSLMRQMTGLAKELIGLETKSLVPKLKEAQMKINAHT